MGPLEAVIKVMVLLLPLGFAVGICYLVVTVVKAVKRKNRDENGRR